MATVSEQTVGGLAWRCCQEGRDRRHSAAPAPAKLSTIVRLRATCLTPSTAPTSAGFSAARLGCFGRLGRLARCFASANTRFRSTRRAACRAPGRCWTSSVRGT